MSSIFNRWLATNEKSKPFRLRSIQLGHLTLAILSLAAFVPVARGLAFNGPDERFVDKLIDLYFVAQIVLFMLSVALSLSLRKLKFGPREGDGWLFLIITLAIFLATLLAAQLMFLTMPLAILGLGVYNTYIAEGVIRDLRKEA